MKWYNKSGQNISALGFSGLPRGRGQKGGKPKRQRSKVPPTPDNYTLRPGLVSISSGNAVMSPIVQVSEHYQPLNVSTTISVLPETSHVNVSGVVQESFNASTSLSSGGNLQDHDILAQYQSHFNNHRNIVQLHSLEMGMGKAPCGLRCHKLQTDHLNTLMILK